MGFCSVRLWCWIVAILFMVFAPLGAIYCIFVLCISDDEKREYIEDYDIIKDDIFYFCVIGAIYCLLMLCATIALIVGLKKSRAKLLLPFIIVTIIGGFYFFVRMVMVIVRGVKAEKPAGEVALEALPFLIIAILHSLLRAPVYVLRKRMLKAPYKIPERRHLGNSHYLQRNY